VLDVRLASAIGVGDELLSIGAKIAIRILKQPQVRRLPDQHAAVEHLEPSRQDETILKDGALVHAAVTIRVFKYDNLPDGCVFARRLNVPHVPRHLNGPETPLAIPVDHHGIQNERLAGHQLHPITGRHVKPLRCLLGGKRRGFFNHLLKPRRPGAAYLRSTSKYGGCDHQLGECEGADWHGGIILSRQGDGGK
jgi:hypothetical protein